MGPSRLPNEHVVISGQTPKPSTWNIYPAINPVKLEMSFPENTVVIIGASRGIGGKNITAEFAKAAASNVASLAVVEKQLKGIDPKLETLCMNNTDIQPVFLRESGLDYNATGLAGASIVWLATKPERSAFEWWDCDDGVRCWGVDGDEAGDYGGEGSLLTMQWNAKLGAEQFGGSAGRYWVRRYWSTLRRCNYFDISLDLNIFFFGKNTGLGEVLIQGSACISEHR
ncbi:hypothetical protein BJ878DRAFT_478797 [Calycina marina]|uniref:Uncharacterized protein n=1 Tax=Calycina marina TaxID=1763456 RepID=A0A9P8CGK4_9HELO|nr:hypothetical protein BJ878DRAFT_478797 [Calycina marina]